SNLAGVVQPLQDGVDRRQFVRVDGEIDAHALETIADFGRRERQTRPPKRQTAGIGQTDRHRGRQTEQAHQRTNRLRELGEAVVELAALCPECLIFAGGRVERRAVVAVRHMYMYLYMM